MRKLIIVGVGIILLAGAFFIAGILRNSKKIQPKKVEKAVKTVFTTEIKNKTVPLIIKANGNLVAKNKIELYSEVQGILRSPKNNFRAGVSYKKGQTILKADDSEFYASIQSQRSALQSLIASIIPDIRLDYPASFKQWDSYLKNFNVNGFVEELPKTKSDKEKYFITGKNIYTTYYTIKNLEARLAKYTIVAPFNGVLTEANISNGTLVRAGQKIGEFINPDVYELPLSVKSEYSGLLKVGELVKLYNLKRSKVWSGKVIRVNGRVDQTSQTIQVFIEVQGKDLKEGMYLEAAVKAKDELNAVEVNRKLLVDNKGLYVVTNGTLELVPINPIYFNEETVVVKGLKDGAQMLSRLIPGVYPGMAVNIFTETKSDQK